MKKSFLILCVASLITGCRSFQNAEQTSNSTPLTFSQAITQLSEGLDTLIKESSKTEGNKTKIGLVPSKVTAVFNITTSTKNSNSATSSMPVSVLAIGGGFSNELNTSKGNTITIEFENVNLSRYNALLETFKAQKTDNPKTFIGLITGIEQCNYKAQAKFDEGVGVKSIKVDNAFDNNPTKSR